MQCHCQNIENSSKHLGPYSFVILESLVISKLSHCQSFTQSSSSRQPVTFLTSQSYETVVSYNSLTLTQV